MVEEEVELHRLVWSPDDFDGCVLQTSAFRKDDLRGGKGDFVSVSRVDMLDADAEIALAESQAEKADGVQFVREEAFSALLLCLAIREARDNDDATPFEITSEPIPGKNEAHCGIRNVTGRKSNGYLNQLRLLLVELVHRSQRLDDFLNSLGK